jgi:hypothetical protein
MTRLGRFLKNNRLKPYEVADVIGISRQHLYRLRYGASEPTRPVMIWTTIAVRRLLQRRVRLSDLFDLGDGDGE